MLKTLKKKQLLELFQSYFIDRKTGKARSKSGTIMFLGFFVFLFVSLGFTFYNMADGIGSVLLTGETNWMFFALTGLIAIGLGVFGSVFNTYASVYLPKDNELLLSLPIPKKTLLLARLFGVFITSLMYSALVWIPSLIAYWTIAPVGVLNVVFPILMTFIIALFVSVLSCLLGFVVAIIVSKTKGKSFITVFFSLAVLVLYYLVYFKIIGSIDDILTRVSEIGESVKSWLFWFYLLGKGCDGEVFSSLAVIAITLVVSALVFLLVSRSFTKLSITDGNNGKKAKYTSTDKRRTIKNALVRREFKHFTSVSTWLLNGGFGLLLLPVAMVALIIKSGTVRNFLPEIASEYPELISAIPVLLPVAVCFLLSMNTILPVSVSMEGKSLWILQSLPIEPWDVLQAKESMCVRLCIYPSVAFVLTAGIVLGLKWYEIVLAVIALWIFVHLIADFGLYLNLKMPNLSWTNVAALTKQSAPVVINMFAGLGFCAVIGVGGMLLSTIFESCIVLAVVNVIFAVVFLLIHRWLKTKGTKIFASL